MTSDSIGNDDVFMEEDEQSNLVEMTEINIDEEEESNVIAEEPAFIITGHTEPRQGTPEES